MLSSAKMNLIGLALACAIYKWLGLFKRIRNKFRFLTLLKSISEMTVEEIKKSVKSSGKSIEGLVKGTLDS
jgi:hypothetical protein